MPFDPDKYLASKQKAGFDPDKYLADKYEAEATQKAADYADANKPGMFETAAYGIMQGPLRGFGDEIGSKLAGMLGYDEGATKAALRSRMREAEVENPITSNVSEFVSTIASTPMVLNPFGAAAVAGGDAAVRSLGEAKQLDGKAAQDAAVSGTIGAGLGFGAAKVAPKLTEAASKYGARGQEWLSKLLKGKANEQAVLSLGGTKKQLQSAMAKDKIDDLGSYLLDDKITTPLASKETIAERLSERGAKLADETVPIYDAAKNVTMTAKDLQKAFADKADELALDPGSVPVAEKLQTYIRQVGVADDATKRVQEKAILEGIDQGVDFTDDQLMAAGKNFNPSDLRKLRQSIQNLTNFDSDAVNNVSGKVARSVTRDQEMRLIESLDPALRAKNEDLFRKIHLNSIAEEMADSGAAGMSKNNPIGLNTWQAGNVVAELSNGGTVAFVMGAREFARRYGNQVNANVLNGMSKAAQSPRLTKLFEAAMQKGPQTVTALHAALQNDPEYKALLGGE